MNNISTNAYHFKQQNIIVVVDRLLITLYEFTTFVVNYKKVCVVLTLRFTFHQTASIRVGPRQTIQIK